MSICQSDNSDIVLVMDVLFSECYEYESRTGTGWINKSMKASLTERIWMN